MRFLPVNQHSVLIELASLDETLALYDTLQADPPPGIVEMVPAARTLLVRFSRTALRLPLVQTIARLRLRQHTARRQQQVVIPLRYNGEDLSAVAEFYGISVQALINRHQHTNWKVAFIGFAPGFAYLVSGRQQDDKPAPDAANMQEQQSGALSGVQHWQTPRRDTPRTRIPPGSVALAGEFSGVYPQASPGGWQLIGQTSCRMWDTLRAQPALLQPGMEVQFIDESGAKQSISLPGKALPTKPAANKTSENGLTANAISSNAISANTGLVTASQLAPRGELLFTVLQPGLQTSWQDGGRPGCAAMGLVAGGAMDKSAWRDANWLVGNPLTTPCLEITLGGFHARAQRDMVLAMTGAPCRITLLTACHHRYNVTFAAPFSVAAGDEIIIDAPVRGVRSYLAIRGGADVAGFLGSAAWDSLAAVGVPPLQAGDMINAASGLALTAVQPAISEAVILPAKGDAVTLDIIAGPRTDWFSKQALQTLTGQAWQVTAASNRSGLRLAGECGLTRSQLQELPSEGTCSGAIQVPASGQPVLFLRDHPLTGGYPVIAAVADYHLDLAGQIPPAAWLRFRLIEPFQEITGDAYLS